MSEFKYLCFQFDLKGRKIGALKRVANHNNNNNNKVQSTPTTKTTVDLTTNNNGRLETTLPVIVQHQISDTDPPLEDEGNVVNLLSPVQIIGLSTTTTTTTTS
ncbi:hypothetical protein DFA_09535 [Cavenderia fasciculata]|uniref:Uncharacterized protein n=1 Tax=Cavenderia fasciculata TaxID=261658 RepID=F4Q7W6_CACFS|nr:uncharacterized protein DFA_09535 [Cavenderia fasciculata]EGG15866.1 hypothetical protein DFA_09535 [Cavenderia fasciculata]|eukprot:XP_004352191.1 hypothetical protein DFA_09535 [Cavenderia fasciculata]